jgi:hypothetical protein
VQMQTHLHLYFRGILQFKILTPLTNIQNIAFIVYNCHHQQLQHKAFCVKHHANICKLISTLAAVANQF